MTGSAHLQRQRALRRRPSGGAPELCAWCPCGAGSGEGSALRGSGVRPVTAVTCALVVLILSLPGLARADDASPPEQAAEESDTQEESSPTIEIAPVVLTGPVEAGGVMAPTPMREEVVTRDELMRRQPATLEEALRTLGGARSVTPTSTATGLSLDGLPASMVQVFIDGRPYGVTINTPEGPLVDLGTLPVDPARIERIEIHRGVAPAGLGGGSGVVVHIHTRIPEQARLDWMAGQFLLAEGWGDRTLRGSLALPIGARWNLSLRGSYLYRPPVDVDGDGRYDTTEQRVPAGGVEAVGRLGGGLTLRAGVEGWLQRSDVRRSTEGPTLGAPPEDRTRTHFIDTYTHLARRMERGGSWETQLQLALAGHRFVKVVRTSGEEIPKAETERERLRHTFFVRLPLGERWFLVPETLAEGERVARSGDQGSISSRQEGRVGAGLGAVHVPSERVEVEGRFFGDAHSTFGAGGLVAAGAAWTPWAPWTLRAGWSLARRLPSVEERALFFDHSEVGYQLQGNPDLRPERLMTWRGGSVVGLWARRLELEGEAFYHDVYDAVRPVLARSGAVALYSYENGGRARSGGLNASGRLQLGGGWRLGATWTWLALRSGGEGGGPRLLTAAHAWSSELAWVRPTTLGAAPWEAALRAQGRSALTVQSGAPPADASWTLDALAQGPVWGPLLWRVEGRNLLDRVDSTWGPKPGRALGAWVGMSATF